MKLDLLAGTGSDRPLTAAERPARIAVFDSGLGGLTVHAEIAAMMPGAELIYIGDTEVFPYGRLSEDVLVARVSAVIGEVMRLHRPDLVVIACNTASTLVLPVLRARFDIPFVGTVPAIKPAAQQSRSRRFSVLATPGTVARDYTRELIAAHAADCRVTLVGSERLASFAQRELEGVPASDGELRDELFPAFVEEEGTRTDVVVLACTHYPLILPRLSELAPWPATFIDSAPAIARRVVQLAGEQREHVASVPAQALFTAKADIPPVLRAALASRGIAEAGILDVTGGARC